jgi:hypothetical protein
MSREGTATKEIRHRLRQKGHGWVFTPYDLRDLGRPNTIGMALARLQNEGLVRRLDRGLYDVPKTHPRLGVLSPDPERVAQALARRGRTKIQPSEAAAANILRLSEQVPARAVYATDGRGRIVTLGNQTVELRHTAARKLGAAPASNLVFAALRGIGRSNVTNRRVAHLRTLLGPDDRRRLLNDLPLAPAWMHPYLRYIAGADELRD